jgi:surface protein
MKKYFFLLLSLFPLLLASDSYLEHNRKAFSGFTFSVATTTSPQDFTIPTTSGTGNSYNCTVDWGDGTPQSLITSAADADKTHSYAAAGTYIIKISGTIVGFIFNNGGSKTLIKDIKHWGQLKFTNEEHIFYGCTNLTISATDCPDISAITSMGGMFMNCSSLNQPLPAAFNTSNVTNMGYMFNGCTAYNQPLPAAFDTSKVTAMDMMFTDCSAYNQPLPVAFDTSKVTNMYGMFARCSAYNQPLPVAFDTSKVTNMDYMFQNCVDFEQSLAGFTITALIPTGLQGFLSNVTLDTIRYDALLIAWEAQAEPAGLTANFGGSKYTAGGAAEAARAALIANGWTITDGGSI